MMDEKNVYELFSELYQIQDETIRKLTCSALVKGINIGGWTTDTIDKAPVTVNWKGCPCNLITHIRKVTQACINAYEILDDFYTQNGVPLNRDYIVAGALLHDVGKFLEYTLLDGKPVDRHKKELLRHPISGAILVASEGLPEEIVHIVALHSFEGEKSYKTQEATFVREIDEFVFRGTVSGLTKEVL